MQATGDYNESKETLNVDVLSGPAKENSLDLEDFDTLAAYGEDDYILYTYANNEVQTIAKATLVQEMCIRDSLPSPGPPAPQWRRHDRR